MEANIVTTFKEEGNRMVKGIESGVNLVNKVKIPKGGKTVGVVEKQNKSDERVRILLQIKQTAGLGRFSKSFHRKHKTLAQCWFIFGPAS